MTGKLYRVENMRLASGDVSFSAYELLNVNHPKTPYSRKGYKLCEIVVGDREHKICAPNKGNFRGATAREAIDSAYKFYIKAGKIYDR